MVDVEKRVPILLDLALAGILEFVNWKDVVLQFDLVSHDTH